MIFSLSLSLFSPSLCFFLSFSLSVLPLASVWPSSCCCSHWAGNQWMEDSFFLSLCHSVSQRNNFFKRLVCASGVRYVLWNNKPYPHSGLKQEPSTVSRVLWVHQSGPSSKDPGLQGSLCKIPPKFNTRALL